MKLNINSWVCRRYKQPYLKYIYVKDVARDIVVIALAILYMYGIYLLLCGSYPTTAGLHGFELVQCVIYCMFLFIIFMTTCFIIGAVVYLIPIFICSWVWEKIKCWKLAECKFRE